MSAASGGPLSAAVRSVAGFVHDLLKAENGEAA
jgi:hypothetical protein